MSKSIPLTQGQFAIVDDEDYEYLMQWKWFARWNPDTKSFYAMRNDGKRPNRKSVLMSRDIMKTPKRMICDHINHDTLCNQKYNLRNVTNAQNNMNRRKHNPLGILGVYRIFGGFRAGVSKNGKIIWCPLRKTIEEAIEDRRNAVNEYYGEFSYHQEVPETS